MGGIREWAEHRVQQQIQRRQGCGLSLQSTTFVKMKGFIVATFCCLLLASAVTAKSINSIEIMECEDQGAMCRKNGGSVDECTASMRACKEVISGGPPTFQDEHAEDEEAFVEDEIKDEEAFHG